MIAPLHVVSAKEKNQRSLEDHLSFLGRRILGTLLSPRLLELHRLILSESKRFPALGTRWYESGPNAANRVLAAVLTHYGEAGLLCTQDPCTLAAVFLDSLVNNLQLRKLTGMPVSELEIEQRVDTCVQVFLHGVLERRGNSHDTLNGEDV